jgi:hypothetical protein
MTHRSNKKNFEIFTAGEFIMGPHRDIPQRLFSLFAKIGIKMSLTASRTAATEKS